MIRNIILNAIFKTLCWIFKDIILLDHTNDSWLVFGFFFWGGVVRKKRKNFLRYYHHHFGKEKSDVKSFHKFSNHSLILKKLQTWANWLLFSFSRLAYHFCSALRWLSLIHWLIVTCAGSLSLRAGLLSLWRAGASLPCGAPASLLWLLLLHGTGSRRLGFQ